MKTILMNLVGNFNNEQQNPVQKEKFFMHNNRKDILLYLYPQSETMEEQSRVKESFISLFINKKLVCRDRFEQEWRIVEELCLVPTLNILHTLSKRCLEKGIKLYTLRDCKDSILYQLIGLDYCISGVRAVNDYKELYHRLYNNGPLLATDADNIFDAHNLFIDYLGYERTFREGYKLQHKNGYISQHIHWAYFIVVPTNRNTDDIGQVVILDKKDIEKCQKYKPQDHQFRYCASEYDEIADKVWRCMIFGRAINDKVK